MGSILGFLHWAYLQIGLFLDIVSTLDPISCGQDGGTVKWFKMWLHRAVPFSRGWEKWWLGRSHVRGRYHDSCVWCTTRWSKCPGLQLIRVCGRQTHPTAMGQHPEEAEGAPEWSAWGSEHPLLTRLRRS